MHSNKILLVVLALSLAACASQKTALPVKADAAGAASRSPGIRPAVPAVSNAGEQQLAAVIDNYKKGNNQAALRAAFQLEEQYPGSVWYKRALFMTERIYIQMDQPSDADAAMLHVQSEYPEMADYALWILADYHYSKSRFTEAAALFQDLKDHYPKSSLAAQASYRISQSLLGALAYAPAADMLETFLKENPTADAAPDAGVALGQALMAETRMDDAVQAFRNVWVKFPGTQADQDASKALKQLSASGITVDPWTSDERYERGRNLFRTSQYDKAAEAFGKLLETDPHCANRPDALFKMAVCQFYLGKRAETATALEKMIREYPRDQRMPEVLYWLGKSYSKLGEREKAISSFQKILTAYPDSDWADDALFLSGNIYRDASELNKAFLLYRRLVAEYPSSKFADSAIWWIAWSQYTAGDLRKAEQTLQDLINRYPRSFLALQAGYWQGRIEEKNGNRAKAAEYYRKVLKRGSYTYYGYRAGERLSRLQNAGMAEDADAVPAAATLCSLEPCPDDSLPVVESEDGPPVWTAETRKLLAADPSFRKTLELMHLDMRKEAAAELWHLQEKAPRKRGMLIGLSKAFFELGDYYRSLLLVLRNYEHYLDSDLPEMPADLWLLAYPQGYWDSILAYSRRYNQDPYFIAAIIREESQFRVEALSPVGARGVMQVMPSTGQWIAQAIRLQGFDAGKLFDSDTAINVGTWYIAHLMKRFKGDPLLVAAAYNAGPDAVSAWVGKAGLKIDRDEFVEAIPFIETRGYVKKVLRNYAEYKRIYGKNASGTLQPSPAVSVIGPLINDDLLMSLQDGTAQTAGSKQ